MVQPNSLLLEVDLVQVPDHALLGLNRRVVRERLEETTRA